MKKILLLILFIGNNLIYSQDLSNYRIEKNKKGKLSLINIYSGKKIFKRCISIEKMSEIYSNYNNIYFNDYLLIKKKRKIILFNLKTDKIDFSLKNRLDYKMYPITRYDNKEIVSIDTFPIISFWADNDRRDYNMNRFLFNLKTSKIIFSGTKISATRTNNFGYINISFSLSYQYHGIIDQDGKVIVPYRKYIWESPDGFIYDNNNGLFSNNEPKMGVLSKDKTPIIPFKYRSLIYTINGCYIANSNESKGLLGVINNKDEIIIPLKYKYYSNYMRDKFASNSVFCFYTTSKKRKIVFIDTTNTILNPNTSYTKARFVHEYDTATLRYYFVESEQELTGVYDTELRKEIFPCEYKFLAENSGMMKTRNLIAFKNNKFGLLNLKTQKVQIPFLYHPKNHDYVYGHSELLFYLEKEGRKGYVSLSGKEIIPFEYDEIKATNRKLKRVKINGLWGLYDIDSSKLILPVEFVEINYDLTLEKRGDKGIKKGSFTKENKLIWEE